MTKRSTLLTKTILPVFASVLLMTASMPANVFAQGAADAQGQSGERARGPDLSSAAEKLGVTVDDLRNALGGPPPDLKDAAEKLGVSQQALMDAIGPPPPRQ